VKKSVLPVVTAVALGTVAFGGTAAAAGAAPAACSAADLTGTLGHVEAGAGQRAALLTLTARPGSTCAVSGFPQEPQFVDAVGRVLPTRGDREEEDRTPAVVLDDAHGAQLPLRWTGIPVADGDDPDAPAPAALRFVLPGVCGVITVDWTGGHVFDGGHLIMRAIQPSS